MTLSVLYIIASILPFLSCLWWVLIIFLDNLTGRNHSSGSSFLAFVSLTTLLYACHFIHFVFMDSVASHLVDSVWVFCTLGVYPLFALWINKLTMPETGPGSVLLIPSALFFALSLIFLLAGISQNLLLIVVKLVFAMEVVFTIVYVLRCLRIYRERISNYYADTDGKELKSVGWMLSLFLLTSAVSIICNLIGRDVFYGSNMLMIPSVVFTVLIFAVCYIGRMPVFDASAMQKDILDEQPVETEQSPAETNGALIGKILQVMEEEKLYLKHGLKISDLALAVGSNRTYVSNCINKNLGLTFSDFVSSYRVKFAMGLLESSGNVENLEKIGMESGFASRSQFYRSFKGETGMSPGQWLEKH